MDFPKQKNIIIQNNSTEKEYTNALKLDNNLIPLNNISNLKLENLSKLENLDIKHHICDNTTGESKNPFESYNQNKDENLNFELIAENDAEENNALETKNENKDIAILSKKTNNLFSFSTLENKITFPLLGRKIFRIKKYTKYNKYLNEICTDSDISEEEKNKLKDPKGKKISPFSKVNFSKLKVEEKDERLKNLAKLVKRLRRKVRNLENKVRFNASKLLNKYVWTKLGINTKNKYVPPEFSFDFDKICRALKRVRNHEDFEFADQKHLIENLINLIAEDKLKLDSLGYRRICSQIRMLLNKDQVKYVSKKNSKVTVTFPETEVYITKTEYNKLKKYKDKEEILRAILGVYDQDEKTIKISIDNVKEGEIKEEKLNEKELIAIEKLKDEKKTEMNLKEENEEITKQVNLKNVRNENNICNNNNINESLQDKINQIISNQMCSSQPGIPVFTNNIANIETNCNNNFNNFKQIPIKNPQNNNITDKNNFARFQNNIFGMPLSELNNKQTSEQLQQDNFSYNLMQNPNLLYSLRCLNGINSNLPNYMNPMQMLIMNNSSGNINQNPQYFNNYLMKQNLQQSNSAQNEGNMFSNFYNNSNNNLSNNALRSPKKNNLFFDNQNGLYNNNNNPGNNNLFNNKDKNQNSSYNVFLK